MRQEFQTHLLNDVGIEKAKTIAEIFDCLATALGRHWNPGSRSYHISLSHLEDACFHAKKSMASMEENQKPETREDSARIQEVVDRARKCDGERATREPLTERDIMLLDSQELRARQTKAQEESATQAGHKILNGD